MESKYSESGKERVLLSLFSIEETLNQLLLWNKRIESSSHFTESQEGMILLAANCTLLTAVGEGINRIEKIMPDFLISHFPEIRWKDIIGMRNHIAHGYFELDADIVFETITNDIPPLLNTIKRAICLLTS